MEEWITAADIDNWSNREPRRVQELLPQLVWKLILASCTSIKEHHFPYGKAVQYSGYDGGLDTEDISPFFPTGKSVWEIGTDANALSKFNDDYKKRTEYPNGINQEETAFCFVTSRIWSHKKGIVETREEKESEGIWKSVHIIDANSLAMWLSECPAVAAWLATLIGKTIQDVHSLDEYWELIVNSTTPQLSAGFFTYERKSVSAQVIEQCNAGAKQIVLTGNSSMEALLTLAAELYVTDDLTKKEFLSRCVVIYTQAALDIIYAQYSNAVLIPTFAPRHVSSIGRSNTIIIPATKNDPIDLINKSGNRIEIPQRSHHEYCQALETLGYEPNDAHNLAQDLRYSFPALFRRITTDPSQKVPAWSTNPNVENLLPALFVGAWEESCSGDKDIICRLSGVQYTDYIALIHKFLKGENAPIFSIDQSYACVSISEMWDTLWSEITPDSFARFKECFLAVFSESNPKYDLPETEWSMAIVLGKRSVYSSQMKDGLIISLIMLIERDDLYSVSSFSSHITEECCALVQSIFNSIDTIEKWRTICKYIPAFIEVAPNVVLGELENAAKQSNSIFWTLFTPAVDSFWGETFYTYILWALEITLWDRQYATRALKLLVQFAEKGFEYKLANSPDETLYNTFCFWHPQGVFSQDERKILLGDIICNHHSIAPKLINALLPQGKTSTSGILRPKWKMINGISTKVTNQEYYDICKYTVQCYLDNITSSYNDWEVVFSHLSAFPTTELIVETCKSQVNNMSEVDKFKLCEHIARIISSNRKFKNADWSVDEEQIAIIEDLYFSILPESPLSCIPYFSYHFDGLTPLPYIEGKYDFEAERQVRREFQKAQISNMISKYGINSVIEVAPQIEDESGFADAVCEIVCGKEFNWEFIGTMKQASSHIAALIVVDLYYSCGLPVFEDIFKGMDPLEIGWTLSCLPLCAEVVAYVDQFNQEDIKETFWEQVNVWSCDLSNPESIKNCIEQLLKYNRPYSLINFIAYSKFNDAGLIMSILYAALNYCPNAEVTGMTLSNISGSHIENMFSKLYGASSISEFEIAQLELAYLPAFGVTLEPKYLVNQVLKSPELYMELLTTAYKSDIDNERPVEKSQVYVKRAYHVLDRITRIPGSLDQEQSIDEAEFNKWVESVSLLAQSRHYILANAIVLGKILSYAPIGKDGIWPVECVRHLFEKPHLEELERNFIIGRQNQRGVYAVTGGQEEMRLAEIYYDYANRLQLLYPSTASIVRQIGDQYRSESKSERVRELKGYY